MTETSKQPLTALQENWLQALESGRFQQGQIYLMCNPLGDARQLQYCCLGVAITDTLGWRPSSQATRKSGEVVHQFGDRFSSLPESATTQMGFASDLGTLHNLHRTRFLAEVTKRVPEGLHRRVSGSDTLSGLNDIGVPFKVIAECSRLVPEAVFWSYE